jgi:tetraacyldisaccharide 4'-kinase
VDVVCSGNRREGINAILDRYSDTGVILMDDGYQHRWVDPGMKILLTSYHRPYFDDMLLPSGNLREFRIASRRADIIVVTKCPEHIGEAEMDSMKKRIAPTGDQHVFFAGIRYGDVVHHEDAKVLSGEDLATSHVLMVTGIADPLPMEHHLRSVAADVTTISFPDHHTFNEKDISSITERFRSIDAEKKFVVTTEKDIVRLKEAFLSDQIDEIYCLPIQPVINDEETFLKLINEYTGTGA